MFYAIVTTGKVFRFADEASRQRWIVQNAHRNAKPVDRPNYLQKLMATDIE